LRSWRQLVVFGQEWAIVDGIDISDVSVEKAEQRAMIEAVTENTTFHVMDAENLIFQNDTFDVAVAHGCLHHLDYEKAMQSLSRVIKHDGFVICTEAVKYNPVIHAYRKITPHLRTEWEVDNLLGMKHLRISEKYFAKIDVRFFNLATLASIPFRNTFAFNSILNVLENIDSVLLKTPVLKWMAWQMVIILEKPLSVGVDQPL
jgi:ubiquinone/menaquinone biosynthesis C-methylase UbiE